MPCTSNGRAGPRGGPARKEKKKDRAGFLAAKSMHQEHGEPRRIQHLQDLESDLWKEFRQHVRDKLTEIGGKAFSGEDLDKFVTKHSANLSEDDFETWKESLEKK